MCPLPYRIWGVISENIARGTNQAATYQKSREAEQLLADKLIQAILKRNAYELNILIKS